MTKGEKISRLMKRLWSDPEWVKKETKRRHTRSYRNKLSEGLKRAYKAGIRARGLSPKARKKQARTLTRKWNEDSQWVERELRRRRSKSSRLRSAEVARRQWETRDRKEASRVQRAASVGRVKRLLSDQQKYDEWISKLSKAQKKRWSDDSNREQQSDKLSAAWEHPRKGKNLRRGLSLIIRWRTRMTSLERSMYGLIKELGYQYKFTGGGRGRVGKYVPDFMHTTRKKIIEVYGEHWHGNVISAEKDKRRIADIRSKGYDVLVVRQKEFKNPDKLKEKLRKFQNC